MTKFDISCDNENSALNTLNNGSKAQMDRILTHLTAREERMVRMHFGIGMRTDHTFEEIGKQFTTSRQRAEQVVDKALQKLHTITQDESILQMFSKKKTS